jgi:crotonobetainyl-CoA hydratase/dehydration protein DpgD
LGAPASLSAFDSPAAIDLKTGVDYDEFQYIPKQECPMSDQKYTIFEVKGRVAYITINRPEVRNCLGPFVSWELSQHLDRVESDDDIWLAVLTGAGDKAFCAGMDLKFAAQRRSMSEEEAADVNRKMAETRGLHSRWYFPKPLIARVNGFAMGGGLELALACDIIVAAEHAEVGLPEPKRGLVAGAAGVHRLPRQIGLKPAMGYMLTGRHMPAQRAYELGLVNDVVPMEKLDETVDGYVRDILACAPLSVRATKEMAMRGLDRPLHAAFVEEYEWETRRQRSPDAIEGPTAFAEKRAPNWTGRFEE